MKIMQKMFHIIEARYSMKAKSWNGRYDGERFVSIVLICLPALIILSTTAVTPSGDKFLSMIGFLNREKSAGFMLETLLSLQNFMIMLLHCFNCFSLVALTGCRVYMGLKLLKSLRAVLSPIGVSNGLADIAILQRQFCEFGSLTNIGHSQRSIIDVDRDHILIILYAAFLYEVQNPLRTVISPQRDKNLLIWAVCSSFFRLLSVGVWLLPLPLSVLEVRHVASTPICQFKLLLSAKSVYRFFRELSRLLFCQREVSKHDGDVECCSRNIPKW